MNNESFIEIDVSRITPSPFQHRRTFDEKSLRELAKSIEQDGLIQPITVRPINQHFELIAGERRLRAFKLSGIATIPARVLAVDDLQARRLCATENLQRADLTAIEEVMALVELIDASLLLEFGDEYANIGTLQEPKWRVKTLLMKVKSDRRNGTDYFTHKFVRKIEELFSNLPKPKEMRVFLDKDMPLLFIKNEVQNFAIDNKLNKSQTKAAAELQKAAPEVFNKIAKAEPEKAVELILELTHDPNAEPKKNRKNKIESFADLAADTIYRAADKLEIAANPQQEMPHVARNSGDNEWYTPPEYIAAAVEVMGGIDLDPASSETANQKVNASRFYTEDDDGLIQEWYGRVWMNPPYASELINRFIKKLVNHFKKGDVTESIVLINNATETEWFYELISVASAVTFPKGRVKFWHPRKESVPLQGQAVVYIGTFPDKFVDVFSRFGWAAMVKSSEVL